MARAKAKPGELMNAYLTTWTDAQRASWLAVGEFICRMRREGKLSGKGA